jgi:simple sugar transport system substrate-binding protein
MMQNLTRVRARMLYAIVIAPWLALPMPTTAQPAPPLKVAFVYVTPVGQAGWTYQHDLGRRAMERALGDAETTTVERRRRRRPRRRARDA